MTKDVKIRLAAALLAIAAFMPWYSSQALVDRDTYLGNPLPLIDWLILAVALATVIRPQLATIAGSIGLIDVFSGAAMLYGDASEGIAISLLPGLPLAAMASVALLIFRPEADLPNAVAAERSEDRPRSEI